MNNPHVPFMIFIQKLSNWDYNFVDKQRHEKEILIHVYAGIDTQTHYKSESLYRNMKKKTH